MHESSSLTYLIMRISLSAQQVPRADSQAGLLCAGAVSLRAWLLEHTDRLDSEQRAHFLGLYSDSVLGAREQLGSGYRESFNGLLASLSFQELQDSLLPTALRMTKR